MDDITQRQTEILKAIIKEFSESGEPVGSEILEKKYKLGISPATIRNEMVSLAKNGYIKKAHFSSGRVPSAKGFRFYINKLMKEKELSTADEVAYKNSIWDDRNERHKLLSQATKVLAHRTGLVSVAATNSGDMYYSGLTNLLNIHEFINRDLEQYLFERLEEIQYWERILQRLDKFEGDVYYMLGDDDLGDPMYEACASVFGEFQGEKVKGIIGVVGPKRMNYDTVSPQIKFFSSLLQEIIKTQNL
ncbi:hypothetical protein A2334_04860 [Candidatus Roizmanbacteria bacterium RIFOXYB2_FULL_38_10]|uniref:Heat-inducible transcription repressor HrcA n=1 Tax=Candidatus Roizmanbacteria bacterium RIFOXYD1_FULL_38_12 TaxID=1802093 RepID=A0A1F7KZP6_9BACT|nr:MAG: hypothetical protein A3K47_00960 [Candidatus Roizmanbacteria bacterium RIFOXYA2_FULL_38_14]OGK63354.1 MAG: hypothetical protein A3K27_00960 [Candidatus Roizmanbacteria bacterium RIFOXYA1_FULL_37_12]OGK65200.1 MAG: hypothetical protein A3K38_00960 [Candidatus Roizmanbacteria bacterium RIFOXYB1_FULL_40_23]OGK68754.1 MAG: hypothetical protein A2334_04860 [Candidatus Roizmanbacteria bacterium RIFOXYB2_FULL_38_10]OGK69605.1 MAG: hypothetical protein A3K21_00965 [Candidatus Roizmanbacteria ba